MAKVTIKDVALKAGVSTTTVSHVLNNSRYVEPKTKEKVLEAVKTLDFKINNAARSLRAGKSNTIGLIIPDASNLYFAEYARKIEDFGFKAGYSVIICNSDNEKEKEKAYIDTLVSKQVDGVVFISAGGYSENIQVFKEKNIPVVFADRDVHSEFADVVLLDNEQGAFDATSYLIKNGHTIIGCITGPNYLSSSEQRFRGFVRALNDLNVSFFPDLVTSGKFTISSGFTSFEILYQKKLKPTAIFVFNDMMAIGAINNAISKGLSIPKDISIIGFDNIELSATIRPSLTTIEQPIETMAQAVIDLLIERIQAENKFFDGRKVFFPGSLIVRESTGKPKDNNGKD